MSALDGAFKAYCAGHNDMDGKSLVKMFKDTKIIDKKFTTTDVDLLFTKVCPKGHRRINVDEFKSALRMVADKKGVGADVIENIVSESHGPVLHGTVADNVKFADASNFTGAHKNIEHGHSEKSGPMVVAHGVDDRTKVECPTCGYKSVPQWLNDQAHCLKCDAVLKVRSSCQDKGKNQPNALKQKFKELDLDGNGSLSIDELATLLRKGDPSMTDAEMKLVFQGADKDGSGAVDFEEFVDFIHSPPRRKSHAQTGPSGAACSSAGESQSGTCAKSPDGTHHWKYGKCNFCQVSEGKLVQGAGAMANPGGHGGGCPKGGKCMFKFAKCSKCGGKES